MADVENLEDTSLDRLKDAVFWISVVLICLMGLISAFGNGIVLYIAKRESDFGGFQHVNSVVKHLAFSDLCFGAIGCPLYIVYKAWSKLCEIQMV